MNKQDIRNGLRGLKEQKTIYEGELITAPKHADFFTNEIKRIDSAIDFWKRELNN